jgi:hypothetical protein
MTPMAVKQRPETEAAEAERKERLAAALRENLKRRKAQARGRRDTPTTAEPKLPEKG